MAGKPPVIASRSLAFALDSLSKNTLIDLVVQRAKSQLGFRLREGYQDGEIAELIQSWIVSINDLRKDKVVSLKGRMAYLEKNDADYRNKVGKYAYLNADDTEARDHDEKPQYPKD